MAFVRARDDFSLDDNGILQDSLNGLIIDDNGIVRDEDDDVYRYVIQWTDSGFGGDKQSSTSTLLHRQNSFEDDLLAPVGDESINISELEASKDDLSFDKQEEKFNQNGHTETKKIYTLDFPDSKESTLDKPVNSNNDRSNRHGLKETSDKASQEMNKRQLFSEDYYRQLHDLGILVDGVDLSRDSLNDLDESHVASQMDGNVDGSHGNSQDLIGEYLESEIRKEQEDEERGRNVEDKEVVRGGSAGMRKSASGDVYSVVSSRTLSSYSFPDEDEEYDKNNGSKTSIWDGHAQQNRRPREAFDDGFKGTISRVRPDFHGDLRDRERRWSRDSGGGSRSATPVGRDQDSRGLEIHVQSNIQHTGTQRRADSDARNGHTSIPALTGSRPASRTSHAGLELTSADQIAPEDSATKRLRNSISQESFFEGGQLPQSPREKTHQKRILPKPSNTEPSYSFRVKNKITNSSGTRSAPVRPPHAAGSDISYLSHNNYQDNFLGDETVGDGIDYVDESAKELSDRLTQEAQKRKQATELVQQLQKDYGSLLTKYALAELTIDQMRLGAKMTLFADSPTPSQAQSVVMSPVSSQHGQIVSLHQSPSHGVLVTSPAQGMIGTNSPVPGDQRSRSRTDIHQGSTVSLLQSVTGGSDGRQMVSESGLETVKADLMSQVQNMEQRLESFCVLLDGGELTLQNQEKMFEEIKDDHDQVRRAYLQVKDEYNVLRRSGALTVDSHNFDQNKELEGHLFRLGMRFDEVHEKVENSVKERSNQRLPFYADGDRKKEDNEKRKSNSNRLKDDSKDNSLDHQTFHNTIHTDVVDTSDATKLERRVHELREEYNANMDMYRKLKYTSNTPDGEREMEHIVMKLNDICTDMPDMFRLSPEIQARRDQMLRDNRLKVNDRKNYVWEKLNKREQEMKQQRKSPVSQQAKGGHSSDPHSPLDDRAPSISRQGSNSSDQDSLRARLDGNSSRSNFSSILPDRMNQPTSRGGSGGEQSFSHSGTDRPPSRGHHRGDTSSFHERPSSATGTPGADESFSDSMSHGHDTSNPSLPRARRHQHGMKDPKHSQMPDISGGYRLPHNTTTEQDSGGAVTTTRGHQHNGAVEGATGSLEGYEGALAALPGPGKMKQMTKQRAADDADSGFIGSMVGSGVGVHPGQLQLQQQQQQQLQQQQQQLQQEQQQQVSLRLSAAVDKSSTMSDQSLDVSDQAMGQSRTRQRRVKADSTSQRKSRATSDPSSDTGREDSYDGEEDTAETLASDISMKRGNDKNHRRGRNAQERSEESQDATLEGSYTEESDVSTPRAANQSQSISKERIVSEQTGANQKTPTKSRKSSTQEQMAWETAENLEDTKTAKAIENRTESLQTSERDRSISHRRLKSPLPHSNPQSRGSPTTEMFYSREKLGIGGSRRASGGLTEFSRQKEQERRSGLPGSPMESHRSRDVNHAGLDSGLPLGAQNVDTSSRVKEYEDRSTGSEVEFGSTVTRGSSVASSNRLKALQEEIERLKEGVAKANERANQPPPPPQFYHLPPQPPVLPQRQEPEYYDPFDDPYGFMRMPRRRANSFSGGREREWDEWYWTLPQNRQYDGGDIPLGYAAADAYADLPLQPNIPGPERNTRENIKNRLRHRRMDHRQRRPAQPGEPEPSGSGGYVTANPQPHLTANQQSHLTANQPPHLTTNQKPQLIANQQSHLTANQPPHLTTNLQQRGVRLPNEQAAARYGYYMPSRYSAASMRQQIASQGYFTTPSGGKIYSSTGDEGDNEEDLDVVGDPARTSQAHSRPWYQIRRLPQPFTSGYAYREGLTKTGGSRRTQSQEDVSNWSHAGPYYGLRARSEASPYVAHRTNTQLCPMCGSTGNHTHTRYTSHKPRSPGTQHSNHGIVRETSPTRRSRRDSRSPPRLASERSRSQSHYRVREYRHLSDTDEEEEERISRRSRSLSRGRSRKKSHVRSLDRHDRRRRSDSLSDHSDVEETRLEKSLNLSEDIGHLTKKMLRTVSAELRKSKDMQKEFGSSFW